MLENILATCFGKKLYDELAKKMGGKTLIIEFNDKKYSEFLLSIGTITLDKNTSLNGQALLHEMVHAYQAYQENSADAYYRSLFNKEVESHYAQYLYLSNRPGYEGSEFKDWYQDGGRMESIKGIEQYLDEKGNLKPGKTNSDLNNYIKNNVRPAFEANDTYKGIAYNESISGVDNLKNMRALSKDC
jgi:hypothetical protein